MASGAPSDGALSSVDEAILEAEGWRRSPVSPETPYPFSGIVGHETPSRAQARGRDPMIGGVLLRGEKGSARPPWHGGLARLLGDGGPFVDLPLGATEDRLIGTTGSRPR